MLYTSAKIGNRKRTTNIVCWCWGKHVMNDIENSLKLKTKTKENTCGFSYDAYGRPVSCGNDIHEQSIVYDKVGNIASVAEKIDGLTFLKSQSRSAHSRRRQLAQLQPLSLLPWLYISRNFFNSSIFSFAASLPIW